MASPQRFQVTDSFAADTFGKIRDIARELQTKQSAPQQALQPCEGCSATQPSPSGEEAPSAQSESGPSAPPVATPASMFGNCLAIISDVADVVSTRATKRDAWCKSEDAAKIYEDFIINPSVLIDAIPAQYKYDGDAITSLGQCLTARSHLFDLQSNSIHLEADDGSEERDAAIEKARIELLQELYHFMCRIDPAMKVTPIKLGGQDGVCKVQ